MDILEEILAFKKEEVKNRMLSISHSKLENSIFFDREPISMVKAIRDKTKSGIIAEFKRQSPSKGVINAIATVKETTLGYVSAGASGLSILTDNRFFGGRSEDLVEARELNSCPILRKDFVIDEYQVIESKSIGADCILLIARILDERQVQKLAKLGKLLGLEVLVEIDSPVSLSKLCDEIDIVGVNNRNLQTFKTSLENSESLVGLIPDQFLKISESGIHDASAIDKLKKLGFEGFLIGEKFMSSSKPEDSCKALINTIVS